MRTDNSINEKRALRHLLDLLAVEGQSGREKKVACAVRDKLLAAGCKRGWIKFDHANKRIPGDYEIGNLIVTLPGTMRGGRRLFSGHLDTVPLCRGSVPVRKGNRITAKGKTGLGADDRTAVACMVNLAETLLADGLPYPPVTLLFTVGEESGLRGSRLVSRKALGNPVIGFNIDGGVPADLFIGAIGADRWQAEVIGKSSHAGVHPEDGVSAILIASRALADVAAKGYFGSIVKGRRRGTSNAGIIHGGEATNQVCDCVLVDGESRSHELAFIDRITNVYRQAFKRAAAGVRNRRKQCGRVKFHVERHYNPYRLDEDLPVVQFAVSTARALGLKPHTRISDGGYDASSLNLKSIPTVTIGAGQHNPHTLDEYVDIREYLSGCRYAVALATG